MSEYTPNNLENAEPGAPKTSERPTTETATVLRSDGTWDQGWKIEDTTTDAEGNVRYRLSKETDDGTLTKNNVAAEKVKPDEATPEGLPEGGESFYVKRSDGTMDFGWKVAGVVERGSDGTASKFLMSKKNEDGTVLEKGVQADALIQWQEAPREQLELEPRAESAVEELGEDALESAPVILAGLAAKAKPPLTSISEVNDQIDKLATEKAKKLVGDIEDEYDALVRGDAPQGSVEEAARGGGMTDREAESVQRLYDNAKEEQRRLQGLGKGEDAQYWEGVAGQYAQDLIKHGRQPRY